MADAVAEDSARFYEATAEQYDGERFSDEAGRWVSHRQKELLLRLVPPLRGKRVLEVGCGTGRITAFLSESGAGVTASDPAPEMIAVARQKWQRMGTVPPPRFIVWSGYDAAGLKEKFDVVIFVNVFGRLKWPEKFLRTIAGVLNPGGQVVFNFPNLLSAYFPIGMAVNLRGRSLKRPVYSRWHTISHVSRILRRNGFEKMRVGGHFYLPAAKGRDFFLRFVQCLDRLLCQNNAIMAPSVFVAARLRQTAGRP